MSPSGRSTTAIPATVEEEKAEQRERQVPTWLHVVGYSLAILLGSSGEFLLGVWDRVLPTNQPPSARVEVTNKQGDVPLTVTASAADSSDPEGGSLTYRWFVNGKPIDNEGSTYQHTFDERGSHFIVVEVKDEKGLVDADQETITIQNEFDIRQYLRNASKIEQWLNDGDYMLALSEADQHRYSCEEFSMPSRECAQFHALAAEAQLFLGRIEEGFKSISIATNMMPNDVFHVVFKSQFLILRKQPDHAINELTKISSGASIGAGGSFNLGIAYAIVGKYDDAEAHLQIILESRNRLRKPAEFAQFVTRFLRNTTPKSFDTDVITKIVCSDSSFRRLFLSDSEVVDPHIITLRALVQRLDVEKRRHLKNAIEVIKCT